MRRSELKKLTDLRLKDARSLLKGKRYAACYYLAGYAVECAIKVCIAKQFKANTVPDRTVVNQFFSHSFEKLIEIAGLKQALKEFRERNEASETNWNVVKDWKPEKRYELQITKKEAEDLYNAITDRVHGVDQWLRQNW